MDFHKIFTCKINLSLYVEIEFRRTSMKKNDITF
jgi:hypothetical protein